MWVTAFQDEAPDDAWEIVAKSTWKAMTEYVGGIIGHDAILDLKVVTMKTDQIEKEVKTGRRLAVCRIHKSKESDLFKESGRSFFYARSDKEDDDKYAYLPLVSGLDPVADCNGAL